MKSLIDDSVSMCDEIINMPKTILINVIDKQSFKGRYYIFHTFFISSHIVISNLWYLLLLHKRPSNK